MRAEVRGRVACFFFQAEDGIRDYKVTGVQTCALPISVEVCVLTRRPVSEVLRAGRTPLKAWRVVRIGLMPPREKLNERIHARTDAMLEQGWMREVQALLESGMSQNSKPFDFIGYHELRAVLRGEITLEEARGAIQQATRRYAKRQLTWFRKEQGVRWFARSEERRVG